MAAQDPARTGRLPRRELVVGGGVGVTGKNYKQVRKPKKQSRSISIT